MLYEEYMEDYLKEYFVEMQNYLIEAGKSKEDVYKINYYMRDNLQMPYVSEALKKNKTQEDIIEFTGKFIDDHHKEFGTAGPVYNVVFGDKETSFLYNLFKIDKDILLEIYANMVKETYINGVSKFLTGFIQQAPHKLLLTAILIDALQNNYEDIVTCMEYLWAFSEYPILYRTYWSLGVKEDLMDFTIEHLGSKYQVKKVANLLGLLKYDATAAVAAMKDGLISGADHIYLDFTNGIRSRINSKFRNISKAYYDNDKKNATQHDKTTQFDDGSLADQDGITTNIASIVDNTINKYITGEINASLAGVVADANKIDKNNLIGYINQINGTKGNMINKFIENVITIYFMKNPSSNGIDSSDFVSFGLSLYRSIGMSKDDMYKKIREILDHWMFDIINIRETYQREATVINYTRAIYNYMILMINYYN